VNASYSKVSCPDLPSPSNPGSAAEYTSRHLADALRDLGDLRLALYRATIHDRLIGRGPLRRWTRLADRAAARVISQLEVLAARASESPRAAAHAHNGTGNGNGATSNNSQESVHVL